MSLGYVRERLQERPFVEPTRTENRPFIEARTKTDHGYTAQRAHTPIQASPGDILPSIETPGRPRYQETKFSYPNDVIVVDSPPSNIQQRRDPVMPLGGRQVDNTQHKRKISDLDDRIYYRYPASNPATVFANDRLQASPRGFRDAGHVQQSITHDQETATRHYLRPGADFVSKDYGRKRNDDGPLDEHGSVHRQIFLSPKSRYEDPYRPATEISSIPGDTGRTTREVIRLPLRRYVDSEESLHHSASTMYPPAQTYTRLVNRQQPINENRKDVIYEVVSPRDHSSKVLTQERATHHYGNSDDTRISQQILREPARLVTYTHKEQREKYGNPGHVLDNTYATSHLGQPARVNHGVDYMVPERSPKQHHMEKVPRT